MIKLENTEVVGWEAAIRGMRNPKNSWDRCDSCTQGFVWCNEFCGEPKDGCDKESGLFLGPNDYKLMTTLANGGPVHAKYRRMIAVYVDITAPLYWWKEFDTYKVGTVANSCSTMHKIAAKEFTLDDFSHEHLLDFDEAFGHGLTAEYCEDCGTRVSPYGVLGDTIKLLNLCREKYLAALKTEEETGLPAKDIWWQMIQLLPSSYNQRRTVMLNYEVLANIYPMRKNHKLDEWHTFCDWIKSLPYSELITFEKDEPEEIDIFDENVTFEGILKDFEKHHHFLGRHVVDYRPGSQPYTIHIWLDVENAMTGSREVIYDYKTKECTSV